MHQKINLKGSLSTPAGGTLVQNSIFYTKFLSENVHKNASISTKIPILYLQEKSLCKLCSFIKE